MTPARVSPNMKRLGVVAALAVAGGALWYLQHSRSPAVAADAPPPRLTTAAPADTAASAAAKAKPFDKVTRLASIEERKQVADRIASAQAARAASRSAPIPRLPDGSAEGETAISKTEIRTAMRELVPHIVECYEAAIPTLAQPDMSVLAKLTLIGDPDVGTIVDAHELVDADGAPLPAAFDDCLRSTFQLMALPPLAEGDKIEVRYPFIFRTK